MVWCNRFTQQNPKPKLVSVFAKSITALVRISEILREKSAKRASEVQLIGLLKSVRPHCCLFHTATSTALKMVNRFTNSKVKNIRRTFNSEF